MLIYLLFIIIPFVSGTLIEKSHYKSIRRREEFFLNSPLINSDCRFSENDKDFRVELVSGSAVISIDYFKRLLGFLINLFGRRIPAFESLTDRARREATLRMRLQAIDCDALMNVRLETSKISETAVESLAYGTAIYYKKS